MGIAKDLLRVLFKGTYINMMRLYETVLLAPPPAAQPMVFPTQPVGLLLVLAAAVVVIVALLELQLQ